MAESTYDFLGEAILTGTETSVTFSGIDQSYKHLVVEGNWDTAAYARLYVTYNSITTGYYDLNYGVTNTSSVLSYYNSNNPYFQMWGQTSGGGAYPTSFRIEIPNYTGGNNKSGFFQTGMARKWSSRGMFFSTSTAAVNSLTFTLSTSAFTSESYVRIYGITGG